MHPGEYLKKAWPILTEELNDPLAPIKFQNATDALEGLGRMLAQSGKANEDLANELTNQLCAAMLDDVKVLESGEFIIALAAMLRQSIIGYIGNKVR